MNTHPTQFGSKLWRDSEIEAASITKWDQSNKGSNCLLMESSFSLIKF